MMTRVMRFLLCQGPLDGIRVRFADEIYVRFTGISPVPGTSGWHEGEVIFIK